MKKRLYIALAFLLAWVFFYQKSTAQTLEICRQVISVASGTATTHSWQLSHTIGEPVIHTLKGEISLLSQGFHQPEICLLMEVGTDLLRSAWDLKLYPNPTSGILNLSFGPQAPTANLQVMISDMMGVMTLPPRLLSGQPENQLDCTPLPAGAYFLHLLDPQTGQRLALPFIKIRE